MARFILVHGACHGAWCWDKVADRLRNAGHEVLVPQLPGRPGADPDLQGATLERYIDTVVALIDQSDEASILVGHSMGGLSVTGAAEARPDKVARVIYLTAYAAIDGDSVGSILEGDPHSQVPAATEVVADGLAVVVAQDRIIPIFYNDLPQAEALEARARLVPEPAVALGGVVRVTPHGAGSVKRSFIGCTQDQCIAIGFQRTLAERAGCDWAGEIDASHSPFLSKPDEVAERLVALAT